MRAAAGRVSAMIRWTTKSASGRKPRRSNNKPTAGSACRIRCKCVRSTPSPEKGKAKGTEAAPVSRPIARHESMISSDTRGDGGASCGAAFGVAWRTPSLVCVTLCAPIVKPAACNCRISSTVRYGRRSAKNRCASTPSRRQAVSIADWSWIVKASKCRRKASRGGTVVCLRQAGTLESGARMVSSCSHTSASSRSLCVPAAARHSEIWWR